MIWSLNLIKTPCTELYKTSIMVPWVSLLKRRLDISQSSLSLMSQSSQSGHSETFRTRIEIAEIMENESLLNFSVKSNRTLMIYFNPC
ncbi:hypothetical protein [Ferroplasma sp. Type II]|uniref:hypothetical protein n=1 Tax=Ferroplasma sp. Type II TaxID=261388 RepID=UPI0025BCF28A|nr:hypothetical protein [Ferroplasma sp. Type II]